MLFPKLLARDQATLKSLAQCLTYERRLDRIILDQIKNRAQWPRVVVAGSSLDIAFGKVAVMQDYNPGTVLIFSMRYF